MPSLTPIIISATIFEDHIQPRARSVREVLSFMFCLLAYSVFMNRFEK